MAQELIQKVDETRSTEHFSKVLRGRTKKLNVYSVLISLSLIAGLISVVLIATTPFKDYAIDVYEYIYLKSWILYSGYISLVAGTLILFAFNSLRKRSYAYYEVIADEIEWGRNSYKNERPPIEHKIAIQEFLHSSDLPFVDSNKLGQLIYFIIFIVLIIALAYFSVIIPY